MNIFLDFFIIIRYYDSGNKKSTFGGYFFNRKVVVWKLALPDSSGTHHTRTGTTTTGWRKA